MTATAETQQKYGTILTDAGKRAIANAVATNTPVDITYVAVGDGAGEEYYPGEGQSELKNQLFQTPATQVYVDPANRNYIIVEAYIPEDVGGWTIREMCIKTDEEVVVAIGNYPSTYKPILPEGSSTGVRCKFILEVTNASHVTLKVDPSLIFVTKEYVDNSIENHSRQTNVHGGTYEKKPNRLMLRNDDARCQVNNPVVDYDAVPKKYMEDWVAEFIAEYVAKYVNLGISSLIYPSAFYTFYERNPPPGWMVRNGALIASASVVVPDLYLSLQGTNNAWKLVSENEWQAMSQEAPWNGVGGVPYFVLDESADTIRLPDTRGMYLEDAGFDGLLVGGVHGDAIRNILGNIDIYVQSNGSNSGALYGAYSTLPSGGTGRTHTLEEIYFDAGRSGVPTASVNRPKAFGVLGCVYVGQSAA